MRCFAQIVAITFALALLAPPAVGAKPTPAPSPAPKKVNRAELPTCTSQRVSVEDMRGAYNRIVDRTGDTKVHGREGFDEIGDELGCRWPGPGEEGGQGLIELLEKGGGTTTGMKARRQ